MDGFLEFQHWFSLWDAILRTQTDNLQSKVFIVSPEQYKKRCIPTDGDHVAYYLTVNLFVAINREQGNVGLKI